MTNAVMEKARPTQKEVTERLKGIGITTVPELNRKARQDVEDALEETGISVEGEGLGVTPPMEKPVLTADLAKAVGAVNVGQEEPKFESEQRDARNLFKVIRSYFTGESIWGRLGSKGRRWMNILRKKKIQEASVGEKGDSNALNVGE